MRGESLADNADGVEALWADACKVRQVMKQAINCARGVRNPGNYTPYSTPWDDALTKKPDESDKAS
jgi:hypothetical protein